MLKQFEGQNYLNLETLRKNGRPVQTPVWFVQDGALLYVRTIQDSGKVKRIRRNGKVRVMPCGRVGEPLGAWVPAIARENSAPAIFARVRELLIEKYGAMVEAFEAQTAAQGLAYTVLEISVGELLQAQ